MIGWLDCSEAEGPSEERTQITPTPLAVSDVYSDTPKKREGEGALALLRQEGLTGMKNLKRRGEARRKKKAPLLSTRSGHRVGAF